MRISPKLLIKKSDCKFILAQLLFFIKAKKSKKYVNFKLLNSYNLQSYLIIGLFRKFKKQAKKILKSCLSIYSFIGKYYKGQ